MMRCAIYTRKSTEEGLDQDFNSLDAQREACEAFIQSQRHEGWKLIKDRFDDGGISGGTLERPALRLLLDEIEAGRVQMVVVYKIDRLTRSLSDFAKLVDRFDARGASFVSVTQQFNTSTSMGRLTLNVLLSFAQFEREVTAERIRDKIAASKKKGMWMGGLPPLGYDRSEDGLVINPSEAETVRSLFSAYVRLGNVRELKAFADEQGLKTKFRQFESGRQAGGVAFSRGRLYHLLSNPIYIGKIKHRSDRYEGLHKPIIEMGDWDAVQKQLTENQVRRHRAVKANNRSILAGKLFDESGEALLASHAQKADRRYRYYVSKHLISDSGSGREGWRIPAAEIESVVLNLINQNGEGPTDRAAEAIRSIDRVTLNENKIAISFGENSARPDIAKPLKLQRRGVETKLCINGQKRDPDLTLLRRIYRAMKWVGDVEAGASLAAIAERENVAPEFISNNIKFAFLSPQIIERVIAGRHSPMLTTERIFRSQIPSSWIEQDTLLT